MKFEDQLAPANLMRADYFCFRVYTADLAFRKVYKPILEASRSTAVRKSPDYGSL
jgi:hypothetical protein